MVLSKCLIYKLLWQFEENVWKMIWFIRKLLIIYSTQFSLRCSIVGNNGSLMELSQVWRGNWKSLCDRAWWHAMVPQLEFWAAQPGSIPGEIVPDLSTLWSLLVFSYCSVDLGEFGFPFLQDPVGWQLLTCLSNIKALPVSGWKGGIWTDDWVEGWCPVDTYSYWLNS